MTSVVVHVGVRHAVPPRRCSIIFLLLLSSILVLFVDGHGHMTSPRSRNWLSTAGQDGVNSAASGLPDAEYCSHCLNVNEPTEGSCGISPYHDYNTWLDSTGSSMPFKAQEIYQEGSVITITSYMDTHHNGHIELRYCDLGDGSNSFTPDCFDGNTLTFLEDIEVTGPEGNTVNWEKMPADPNHPERGYLSGGQSQGSKHSFVMKFQLPYGLVGDKILFQWKYITANSCSPEGYVDYFGGNNLPDAYWTPGLGNKICTRPCYEAQTCSSPFNDDGERSATMPEQFFNCAEVSIVPSTPTVSPRPTNSPTTSSPTKSQEPTPSTPQGAGCCTIDFKTCSQTVEGWCSDSETNCVDSCYKWWLPTGAVDGCTARYGSCSSDYECCSPGQCIGGQCNVEENPTGPTNPTPSSTPAPNPTSTGNYGEGCCSWGSGQCEQPNNDWCHAMQSQCEGSCSGIWIVLEPTTSSPTASPVSATPTVTKYPTKSPTTKSPSYVFEGNKCSTEVLSSIDALNKMDTITYTVATNPYTLSVLAEGGAAGPGGSVVSEGQAYGVLTAALALADTDASNPLYEAALNKFYGYYNGWKRMCENSESTSYCQATKYCNGSPCLPGWKHSGDLSSVLGSGAAPDGDVDAIVGMIIFVKVMEANGIPPGWAQQVSDVKDWADKSCTQFMIDNTVLSNSGSHRLLKLGTCWGGYEMNGNNPSYHAPGHYKMMRDFQASIESRDYDRTNSLGGDNKTWNEKWNMLIDTSYKFLNTAQCQSSQGSGLVPNWALVTEKDSNTLEAYSGSFSGSGTPQYEFGAEASRTMWRVAFDAAAYPEEADDQAVPFLDPLYQKLADGFISNPDESTVFAFEENSLEPCPPTVSSVFSAWHWNGFMYGPVLSTLVAFDNQDMIDGACAEVGAIGDGESYYSRSWLVISTMTLNGAVAKAGDLFHGGSPNTGAPSPPVTTPGPTNPPVATPGPTDPPVATPGPTSAPVATPGPTDPPVATPGPTSAPVATPGPTDPPVATPGPTSAPVATPGPTDSPVATPGPTSAPVATPGPTDSPVATPGPTDPPVATPGPTNPPPTPITQTPDYYCDWGNGYEQPDNDYCHGSKGKCEENCNGSFVDPNNIFNPPSTNCIAEWGACTNNHNGCCGGLTCYVKSQWYAQCKK